MSQRKHDAPHPTRYSQMHLSHIEVNARHGSMSALWQTHNLHHTHDSLLKQVPWK